MPAYGRIPNWHNSSAAMRSVRLNRLGLKLTQPVRLLQTSARPHNLPAKALATGAMAGSAGSLVGMGGGFVAIPAMTSRFIGMTQHEAHATSLVSVLFTGASGGASYALAGSVDWSVAATVAAGGIFTANLGARLASRRP